MGKIQIDLKRKYMIGVSKLKQPKTIEIKSLSDLACLNNFTIRVNTKAESKSSREWWLASAFAHFHASNGKFSLPLTITRPVEPKPDFWIAQQDRSEIIGIETTFCSVEKFEQANKQCQKQGDGAFPINTAFMVDDKKSYDQNDIQNPKEARHGMPIYGNFSVTFSIERLRKCIEEKIKKYMFFPNMYFLVVYMNLPSNAYMDDEKRSLICKSLSAHIELGGVFKSISIVWSKENVCELDI